MPRAKPDESKIYQLRATIRQSNPPIWRRIQVPSDMTLGELHDVMQVVFEWDGDHLHNFVARRVEYGDLEYLEDAEDEWEVTLAEVAPAKRSKLTYTYDFGDNWEVELVVEDRLPVDPAAEYPRLLAGERAAPPDDIGGIWSWEQIAEVMRQPGGLEAAAKQDENWEFYLDWFPDDFNPDAFDPSVIDQQLRQA
jgi:hypothetical protein